MTYYYDDDCRGNHWRKTILESDEGAVAWAEQLRMVFYPDNSIVYDEDFRVVKEWNCKEIP